MNEEAIDFTIDWLKKNEIINEPVGNFVLEIMECYLDQNHDEDTIKEAPTIFCEIVVELIENGYLDWYNINMASEETKLAIIAEQIKNIIKDAGEYVTRIEFDSRISPLEKLVYGLTGMILIAFITALISLVIKKWN